MIIVIKQGSDEREVAGLVGRIEGLGAGVARVTCRGRVVLAVDGAPARAAELAARTGVVGRIVRGKWPCVRSGRACHPSRTVVRCGGVSIGDGGFQFIAGPCSVESAGQIAGVARAVKAAGAAILRGGAFKPRTSPYSFQGMRDRGLELLLAAKAETGMPVVTEIPDAAHLPLFEDVDMIQVGARNMQNFELLKELGRIRKPVLLKRGMASTLEELLMSAEHIMSGGNGQVILYERGVRTFEPATRNTLDLSAVPVLKRMTHLPVFVDPSHATGDARLVPRMALAAAAAGADGVMVEVHDDPPRALCDGAQAITPEAFGRLARAAAAVVAAIRANPIDEHEDDPGTGVEALFD